MTAINAPKVNNQELVSSVLVDLASVDLISDFIPSKLNEDKVTTEVDKEDFTNTFICHIIFYAVFCFSLVLHIFIDLGLGFFIQKILVQRIITGDKFFFDKSPSFA